MFGGSAGTYSVLLTLAAKAAAPALVGGVDTASVVGAAAAVEVAARSRTLKLRVKEARGASAPASSDPPANSRPHLPRAAPAVVVTAGAGAEVSSSRLRPARGDESRCSDKRRAGPSPAGAAAVAEESPRSGSGCAGSVARGAGAGAAATLRSRRKRENILRTKWSCACSSCGSRLRLSMSSRSRRTSATLRNISRCRRLYVSVKFLAKLLANA